MKLRAHQNSAQHFITNLNKQGEEQSRLWEDSKFKKQREWRGWNWEQTFAADKISKPGQVKEDADSKSDDANMTGTKENKVSPDQPPDESDLRLEQGDEVKE